jgi:hypothetical protein
MTGPIADPGSFRDPAGRVYRAGDRILRTVSPETAADFEQLRGSGLIGDLVERRWLISSDSADLAELDSLAAQLGDGVHAVIEHPCLPLISYPYEWGFSQLKAAALLHLDVHLAALDRGMTLCDASAYNVQFLGAQPLFTIAACRTTLGFAGVSPAFPAPSSAGSSHFDDGFPSGS